MNGYVVDASVAFEYLVGSQIGQNFVEIVKGKRIIAPELVDAEVMSAVRRGVLRQTMSATRAVQVLEALVRWPLQRVPHSDLIMEAWGFHQNVSAYDALYLATARLHGMELLTSDGRLSRAPVGNIAVINLR